MTSERINSAKLAFKKFLLPHDKHIFLLQLARDCKILDVGCGSNSSYHIKRILPSCNYTGIDVADYNNTMPRLHDKYIIVNPEDFAEEIYKFTEYFDAVLSTHNIEHCNDRQKTIDAMLKAIRPGGQLYMLFPSEVSVDLPSRGGCLNYFDDPTHKGSPPDFKDLINNIRFHNFDIVFAAKRYRPLKMVVSGFLNERKSRKENKVMNGTWAYYGFESLIWAKRVSR